MTVDADDVRLEDDDVDDDPSEERPRSFEHAVRPLVPTEHTDHITEAYEQAIGEGGAEGEGGEA